MTKSELTIQLVKIALGIIGLAMLGYHIFGK